MQLPSLRGNGLENEVNELLRLAPRMDNLQTMKRFLDHKFKVHLETSSDSEALKWKEKKKKRRF